MFDTHRPMKPRLAAVLILAGAIFAPGIPEAALLLQPVKPIPGLQPGDRYHYVFVTVGVTPATFVTIEDYNGFVDIQADATGVFQSLDIQWRAIASTPGTSAQTNISALVTTDAPVFLPDGTMVAAAVSDLFDTETHPLLSTITMTQNETLRAEMVWTGTGTHGESLGSGALGGTSSSTGVGHAQIPSAGWLFGSYRTKTEEFSLYAFSEELEVPAVPAPATVSLLPMGLLPLLRRRSNIGARVSIA